MPWVPKEKEIAAVVAADGRRRYEYFIHRVCETRKVWSLRAGDWALLSDGENQFFPLWPHPVFAQHYQRGSSTWPDATAESLELGEFLRDAALSYQSRGIKPAVFPVPTGSAIVVSWDDLLANLRHELAESYGETDDDE